jgi:hypothetical protein
MHLKKHITQDGYKSLNFFIFLLFISFNFFSQKTTELKEIKKEIKNVVKNTEFEIMFLEKIYEKQYLNNSIFPEWYINEEMDINEIMVFYVTRKKYSFYFLYNLKTKCMLTTKFNYNVRKYNFYFLDKKMNSYNFCSKFKNSCCLE